MASGALNICLLAERPRVSTVDRLTMDPGQRRPQAATADSPIAVDVAMPESSCGESRRVEFQRSSSGRGVPVALLWARPPLLRDDFPRHDCRLSCR